MINEKHIEALDEIIEHFQHGIKKLTITDNHTQVLFECLSLCKSVVEAKDFPKEINPYACGMGNVVDYNKGIRACLPIHLRDQARIKDLEQDLSCAKGTITYHEKEIATLKAEKEQLQVQLSGCGVATLGYTKGNNDAKKGDYGWSQSFEDVKTLRARVKELQDDYDENEKEMQGTILSHLDAIDTLKAKVKELEEEEIAEVTLKELAYKGISQWQDLATEYKQRAERAEAELEKKK